MVDALRPKQPLGGENLAQLREKFPKGLRIKDTEKYLKWEEIASFSARVLRNHDQSLERLAERGGLAVDEIVAILTDKTIQEVHATMGNIIKTRDHQAIDAALMKRLEEQGMLAV